jgi:hypothetical protein
LIELGQLVINTGTTKLTQIESEITNRKKETKNNKKITKNRKRERESA